MRLHRPTALLLTLLAACAPEAESHPAQPLTYAISGQLTGPVIAGVPVTLSGLNDGTSLTVSTDPLGRFTFGGLHRGLFELAPATVVPFSPARRFLSLGGADLSGQDFAGEPGVRLHGKVTGTPTGQVAVDIRGPAAMVRYSDDSGYWAASGLPDGRYTLTPTHDGAVFSPPVVTVLVAGGAVAQDFAASAFSGTPHAISGTVTGASLAGVTVRLAGDNAATVPVAADGSYRFPNLADGTYALYAAGPGALFKPGSRRVVVVGADQAGADFALFAPPPARFAYANSNGYSLIYQFKVLADGTFQPLSPATIATGNLPRELAVDPGGRWLWSLDQGSGSISQFAIGTDGQLTPLSPASVGVTTPGFPWGLSVHPSGKAVYVTGLSPDAGEVDVFQYGVGADGTLSPLTPATVAYGGPQWPTTAYDATGAFAYFSTDSGVNQFSVGADGGLTPLAPPALATPGPAALTFSVAADAEAGIAYVMSQNGVDLYAIGADGTLSPLASPRTSVGFESPFAMALDPAGRAAWFVSQTSHQADACSLLPDGQLGASLDTWIWFNNDTPRRPVADPTGRWLYVPIAVGISHLAVAPDGGLTAMTTIPALGAISLVLVP